MEIIYLKNRYENISLYKQISSVMFFLVFIEDLHFENIPNVTTKYFQAKDLPIIRKHFPNENTLDWNRLSNHNN